MKSFVVSEQFPPASKAKRFGFGYEKKSKDSPSTLTARAQFLTLILELRPNAVSSLFNTAYQPFHELIAENESAIASLCKSVESEIPEEAYNPRQPDYIREQAIQRLIPNLYSLQKVEGANPFWQALETWAIEQNLTDEWCVNHAMAFFRAFDGSDDKKLAFALWRDMQDEHCLRGLVGKSWLWAVHKGCNALVTQFMSNIKIEEYGIYSFTFVHETLTFTVTGPFYKSTSKFKEEVEDTFRTLGGTTIRGARKALDYQQRLYLEEVAKAMKELKLEEPPVRWAADDHFRWLVNYQIPPCTNYREIGRSVGKNEKTIREGIQDVAKLIGLNLRSPDSDKYVGRPRGAKDKEPRRRVDRRREKRGEKQINIS